VALPSPLGINCLFHNKPLPWRALRPTFRILSATRRCSFNLAICCTSKSVSQFVFTIKKQKRKLQEKVHGLSKKVPPDIRGAEPLPKNPLATWRVAKNTIRGSGCMSRVCGLVVCGSLHVAHLPLVRRRIACPA
jgi:hypothetical protein